MNLRDEGLGAVVRDLISQVVCPQCGEHFQIADVEVIGHEDSVWFLKASCKTCHGVGLTVALISSEAIELGTSGLGKAPKREARQSSAVNSEDLLEMHHFLKDFDGDFARLFAENNGGEPS